MRDVKRHETARDPLVRSHRGHPFDQVLCAVLLLQPGFRQRAISEGLVVTMDSPDATTAFVRAEEAKRRRVVKEQSIKPE